MSVDTLWSKEANSQLVIGAVRIVWLFVGWIESSHGVPNHPFLAAPTPALFEFDDPKT